jgi:ABC-type dipeptide/oligopeptide/nickel transport system permease subunit
MSDQPRVDRAMAGAHVAPTFTAASPSVLGRWLRMGKRLTRAKPLGAASAAILATLIILAIFADRVAPFDPTEQDLLHIRSAPSARHVLGTDYNGRDVLSRIVHGARISLTVGFLSVLLGTGMGGVWGLVSGYLGGKFDLVSQRVLEVVLSFPSLILAMIFMAAFGASLAGVILAIAITRIPYATRVIRAVALSVRETPYVEAARAIGASTPSLLVRHISPNCLAPFLVIATAHLGVAILMEATLSFLGAGVPPPAPTWGQMLGGVVSESMRPLWWLVVFPGAAITIAVLAFNLLGDAIRDIVDPRLRGSELPYRAV